MSNTRKPLTLADVNKVAKPTELVVQMCVAGDLFAEHQDLEAKLDEATDRAISESRSPKLNDAGDPEEADPEVQRLAKKIEALEARMERSTFDFRFRKLPDDQWDDLLAAHEPRSGNDHDRRYAVNMVTFPKAAVQASCISPDMSDDEAFGTFWGTLNHGQREHLFLQGAFSVNRGGVSVPKSVTASAVIHSSKRSSATASRSASRTPSSSAE